MREERGGELGGDVAVHFIVCTPGCSGCVDVKAGAGAEVVAVVFAFDFQPALQIPIVSGVYG